MIVLGIIAVLLLGFASEAGVHSYGKFRVQGDIGEGNCRQYYQECTCIGELRVMESYPPQYRCNGFESCRAVNRTVCPAGSSL